MRKERKKKKILPVCPHIYFVLTKLLLLLLLLLLLRLLLLPLLFCALWVSVEELSY